MDRRALSLLGAVLTVAGCAGGPAPPQPVPTAPQALALSSTAFADGGVIPAKFTCAGDGHRPALAWSGDARDAKAFAVVVDDPDAPGGDFYHWVVVDLPAGTAGLGDDVPAGARQIKNSAGTVGWTPPCPPSGTHHYRFTVYGLSAPTGLGDEAALRQALDAIRQAALVQGRLTGLVAHEG